MQHADLSTKRCPIVDCSPLASTVGETGNHGEAHCSPQTYQYLLLHPSARPDRYILVPACGKQPLKRMSSRIRRKRSGWWRAATFWVSTW
jgi:hypothetical protein